MAHRKRYVPPYESGTVFELQRTLLMDDFKMLKWELKSRPSGTLVSVFDLKRLDALITRYESLKIISDNGRIKLPFKTPIDTLSK